LQRYRTDFQHEAYARRKGKAVRDHDRVGESHELEKGWLTTPSEPENTIELEINKQSERKSANEAA
jgi:hypothetical protein